MQWDCDECGVEIEEEDWFECDSCDGIFCYHCWKDHDTDECKENMKENNND